MLRDFIDICELNWMILLRWKEGIPVVDPFQFEEDIPTLRVVN